MRHRALPLLLAAAGTLALASPAAAAGSADVLNAFPYRHVSVVPGAQAPGVPAPAGTLWVDVDDGAAVPRQQVGRAIPADGTVSADAAATDPANCEQVGDQPGVCWRYWQRVGDEVRIWTTYRDASCVLIASLTGERTRLTCAGRTATL
jgi:hypothetical protein